MAENITVTSQSQFIEEANKVFKNLPNSIKQEIFTMSYHSFQEKLRKYMFNKTHVELPS